MAKILFVQNYYDELLGIGSIASFIKPRHRSAVTMGCAKNIINKYRLFSPDIVGIFAVSKDHNWALGIAAKIKSIDRDSVVLLGGPHPTFYPDIIQDKSVDIICIGEGEKPVLNLLDSVDAKENYANIPSLWIKEGELIHKNKLEELLSPQEIPVPDRALYNEFPGIRASQEITVMASRGCPFNCYFCVNYSFNKMYGVVHYRMRKVKDVIQEIEEAKKDKKIKIVKFQDDIFGIDEKWVREFLSQFKDRIGIPFYCLLRSEYVSEERADLLKDAGCFRVGVGIESGDTRLREEVLNKHVSDESIRRAVKILKSKKLEFHTFNMFGFPGEELSSAFKTLDFNIRLKPDTAYSTLFQPYPGSKFFSKQVESSMLSRSFDRFKINYNYSKDSLKIQRLQKLFMLTVRFPRLRYLLPVLISLPFNGIYDMLSQAAWIIFYSNKLKRKRLK
ncbi:MAG: radical SAM protein [Candidatus Omnitrophica bacterium]|nr:radical SAM protein [Candidatus Omnitrophota bacterium]